MDFLLNAGWRRKTKQLCLFDATYELNAVRLISVLKKSYYNVKNNDLNSGADLIQRGWYSADLSFLFLK